MADGTSRPRTPGEPAAPARMGEPTPRVDGRLKVMGAARYGSDHPTTRPAYGYLATSRIARGAIVRLDETVARALAGVLDVFTYKNVGEAIIAGKTLVDHGPMGSSIAPLASPRIFYHGQAVALVVAETFEIAREAALRLEIDYEEEPPEASFDGEGLACGPYGPAGDPASDSRVGDAASAFADAPVRIDAHYATPTQHHNALELFTTTAEWRDDRLTIWEGSQNVVGLQHGVAMQLSLDPATVRVISPFIGGAFGARGPLTQRTAIVALAARAIGRAVKLEPTRAQGYSLATYRAETRHRVRLGAGADGRLLSLTHEGWEVSSRPDAYKVAGAETSTRMYACPNITSKVTVVHADRNTPGFMRSPPEIPYLFALESAMDELAYALAIDPIELRRINDTPVEPVGGLRWTSKPLMTCFDRAAEAFGWATRDPTPGAMRDGEWLIGWGCASSIYPTSIAPATARISVSPEGQVNVQTGTHEIGNGVCTVVAITASDLLGVPLERIAVEVGDSDLPAAPIAGGSISTASVCNAVALGCERLRDRLARAAVADATSAFAGVDPASLRFGARGLESGDGRVESLDRAIGRVSNGVIEVLAEFLPAGAPPQGLAMLRRGVPAFVGGTRLPDRMQAAFGAQFVEVRVHALTREIRVARMVGAYAFGRIMNAKAAESQLMGGQIWGVAAALHEATDIDLRYASYVNNDLTEYLIPVNADVPHSQVIMLPEVDHEVNPLGIKGVGELGNVGMNAAAANAVFHATGVRVRELPIRIEALLHLDVED